MQVEFREFNPFDLWIWLEFETVLGPLEAQYVEEVFDSWFFLGKLGGFNAENMQAQEVGLEISYMSYSDRQDGEALPALMHNMGELEFEGLRARIWFDLGTSDAIALDVLINALQRLSREFVAVLRLSIGGEDMDWPLPEGVRSRSDVDDTNDGWN
ncbi:MAG: DUF3531 family protein [Cyanobacteria bacterium P01_H01_bin.130]